MLKSHKYKNFAPLRLCDKKFPEQENPKRRGDAANIEIIRIKTLRLCGKRHWNYSP
jgi:hypothetical protein